MVQAVLGTGPGMTGGPYKLLKALYIMHSNLGDDGIEFVVDLFKNKGKDIGTKHETRNPKL
jgi:hypothetical protein